jgi:hypothetical protein
MSLHAGICIGTFQVIAPWLVTFAPLAAAAAMKTPRLTTTMDL